MVNITCDTNSNGFRGDYGSGMWYSNGTINISDIIRGLKSKRENSAYIDNVSVWYEEDNEDKIDDFGHLSTYLMFFARFCNITDEFIKKHDIKQYHISLFRRMYYEYDDYSNHSCVNIGYKRPYGNSYVIGDLRDEYVANAKYHGEDISKIKDMEYEDDEANEFLKKIHMRTLELFDLALEELYMPLEFINNSRYGGWEPSQRWQREMKLERVLKNE
jgi:hypothetical protein